MGNTIKAPTLKTESLSYFQSSTLFKFQKFYFSQRSRVTEERKMPWKKRKSLKR